MAACNITIENSGSATDQVFVTMPDSNDMIYHLSHVHLRLAKITDVARFRVRIFHLVLRQVIQPCIRNNRKKMSRIHTTNMTCLQAEATWLFCIQIKNDIIIAILIHNFSSVQLQHHLTSLHTHCFNYRVYLFIYYQNRTQCKNTRKDRRQTNIKTLKNTKSNLIIS